MTTTPVSVKGNSQPAGGFTSQQPVTPSNATPTTMDELIANLTPAVQQFRAASSPLSVKLPPVSLTSLIPGATPEVRIPNVGLGYRIVREHVFSFTFDNTSDASVTYLFGTTFPYGLITGTVLDINGGGTPYSASAWGGLLVALRNRIGGWKSSSDAPRGLSGALVRLTATEGTLNANTAGEWTPSGYQSLTVAATTTATLGVTFYTIEKLSKDQTGLIGALPLQNNSTYATLQTNINPAMTGITPAFPFYVADTFPAATTFTAVSYSNSGRYKFWSVPADASLYGEMVSNSYQVQEARSFNTASTGEEAFAYDIPTNCYFGAAHVYTVDTNGAPVAWGYFSPLRIIYNGGSIRPVTEDAGTLRADQYMTYSGDLGLIPGYMLWDGDATSDNILDTDDAGWINTYAVATPQLMFDVASGAATPLTSSITREVLVNGSVVVIGG